MAVVIDKIIGKALLHNHADKVDVAGDTFTGDVIYPTTGLILTDSDNVHWRLTVETDGALRTQINPGYQFGLSLGVTFMN